MAKAKTLRLPKGVFEYPYLTRPDEFKGKVEYKVNVRIPLDAAQPILDTLNAMIASEKNKDTILNDGEAVDYSDEYIAWDVDEEAGTVVFKAKLKKMGGRPGNEFEQRPDLFDAKLHPLDSSLDVMGGSEGMVIVSPFRWGSPKEGKIGISLRLLAVQVTKVCDRLERDAESYGFSEQDGFDATESSDEGAGEDIDDNGREKY